MKGKEFFYKRHISHETSFTPTAPVKIGRIVDALLSGEAPPYQKKVLKKDDASTYEFQKSLPDQEFVTEAQWDEGHARAAAVTREPCYQFYMQRDAKFQVILQDKYAIEGKDVDICGMADVMTLSEDGKTLFIDDFKSVSATKVKSALHWYWNCQAMGYFRQMAAYRFMAYNTLQKEMGFTDIVCRHMVVTKEMDDLYRVKLYVIPSAVLDRALGEFLAGVCGIVMEKDWIDPPITWDDAEELNGHNVADQDEALYADEEEEE